MKLIKLSLLFNFMNNNLANYNDLFETYQLLHCCLNEVK